MEEITSVDLACIGEWDIDGSAWECCLALADSQEEETEEGEEDEE